MCSFQLMIQLAVGVRAEVKESLTVPFQGTRAHVLYGGGAKMLLVPCPRAPVPGVPPSPAKGGTKGPHWREGYPHHQHPWCPSYSTPVSSGDPTPQPLVGSQGRRQQAGEGREQDISTPDLTTAANNPSHHSFPPELTHLRTTPWLSGCCVVHSHQGQEEGPGASWVL